MKPALLDYEAPTSLVDAVSLLNDPDREAVVMAGGQSLVPMLNLRLAHPDLVVDLRRIEGLDYIRMDGDRLAVGAMTTKRAVERSPLVRAHQPLLHAATLHVGHPQIRNRGTVGGSMAHADPAAEYPAVALVSGTEMKVMGPDGERSIAAEDFFLGYLATALEPGEVLTEVSFPVIGDDGWAFCELSRRHGDFAMVGAAVLLSLDGDSTCSDVRIVVFGAGSTPVRMPDAEAVVAGSRLDEATLDAATQAVRDAIDEPMSDIHASAEYRRHLAGVLTSRALDEAVARATGAP